MKNTLVNLNVNPCKMCMPMGAVTALYGIYKCMSILHGSQGCSTYIRRHMATHYNEPVDIASSSLTEEGTVYGGESNLIRGLLNLIRVYEPEVIGVATTCLAETIGEDPGRIINHFYEQYPEYRSIMILPISTPGYGGTQYEGYMEALYRIVRAIPMETEPNHRVNVITSQLSPGDTRYLKYLLELFELDYILLPDLSENLDGIYQDTYHRLPEAGTRVSDIGRMAGAKATIEMASFLSKSPGEYLRDTYNVPLYRCNMPFGLRDNDRLIEILSLLSGKRITGELAAARGRYLDAMVDGHKYNGEARAVIYGEPDFVYSSARMCVENGVMPVLMATGSKCDGLRAVLHEEVKELADRYYIEKYEILDDIDFQTIEQYTKDLQATLLIGNSDGRRIAEKLGLKLVRRGFPIHDRVGGQRLRSIGYEGSLTYLDEITNAVLEVKESGFREHLYRTYYKGEGKAFVGTGTEKDPEKTKKEITIKEKTEAHPCYNCKAHKYARMHLPIAPKCNISCNYCHRKYDCPNESRPGVTTQILKPEEALQRFMEVRQKVSNLSVVGIAGPGDALANFEETKKTLQLIREQDPEITFCLSTNGLALPQHVQELAELGVSHVTVTMNAIDPAIGARIYRYIDYMGVRYYGDTAAAILMSNQMAGIKMLASKGIVCKVNIVMIKGINDFHVPKVVEKVKELGAAITNIMPMIPVKGSAFEGLEQIEEQELLRMRKDCGEIMEQMYHCRQCRADAIGQLGEDRSAEFNRTKEEKLRVAVATKSGMMVDLHFGHATEFYIYEYSNGAAVFRERRRVDQYCSGSQECGELEDKAEQLIRTISDCNAVIALRIGEAPRQKLSHRGIQVYTAAGAIEASIQKAVTELIEQQSGESSSFDGNNKIRREG